MNFILNLQIPFNYIKTDSKTKKMNLNQTLTIAAILLVLLAIAMIYIGGIYAPKVMLPPIITGVGFFIIAKVFLSLRKK